MSAALPLRQGDYSPQDAPNATPASGACQESRKTLTTSQRQGKTTNTKCRQKWPQGSSTTDLRTLRLSRSNRWEPRPRTATFTAAAACSAAITMSAQSLLCWMNLSVVLIEASFRFHMDTTWAPNRRAPLRSSRRPPTPRRITSKFAASVLPERRLGTVLAGREIA